MFFKDTFHRVNQLVVASPYYRSPTPGWMPKTNFAFLGQLVDSNGNLQINLGSAGQTGSVPPVWNTNQGGHTAEGVLNWDNFGPLSDHSLQIVNNECVAINGLGGQVYVDPSVFDLTFNNDQFVQFTIGSEWNLNADFTSIESFLRIEKPQIFTAINGVVLTGYNMQLTVNSPSDGVHSNVTINDNVTGAVLFSNPSLVTGPGDVWLFKAVGTTLSVIQNGVVVGTAVDSSYTSGITGLGIFPGNVATDVSVSSFSCGDIAFCPQDSRTAGAVIDSRISSTAVYQGNGTLVLDCRLAGAPVDSRVSVPQNSRKPGTFGPGE